MYIRSRSSRLAVTAVCAVACLIGSLVFYGMFLTRIPPGHVGVVVNLLGDSGIEQRELGVGMHWVAPWKDVYEFPTFEQNHIWQNDRQMAFQTCEGVAVSAAIGITYSLQSDHIPKLFAKYRRGIDEITDIFVRNHVRDAINRCASHLKVEDLYGPAKETFFDDVQKLVRSELEPIGIMLNKIYLVGRLHFPENVVAALNAKIEATQRAQQRENELREAEAQAKKEVAAATGRAESLLVEARAKAEANIVLARSVTHELIQYQAVQKWDGSLPQAMSNNLMPMMGMK